jgi:hypothetical protein
VDRWRYHGHFHDALLNMMKNGRALGQSGHFTQLEPVIR